VSLGAITVAGAELRAHIAGEALPRRFSNIAATAALSRGYNALELRVGAVVVGWWWVGGLWGLGWVVGWCCVVVVWVAGCGCSGCGLRRGQGRGRGRRHRCRLTAPGAGPA
jgi:hypothetical protein